MSKPKRKLMVGDRVKTPEAYGVVLRLYSDKVVVEVDYMYQVTYKISEVTRV